MKKETRKHFEELVRRLEFAIEKTKATTGFNREIAHVRLLQEILREQIGAANTHPSNR